MHSTLEDPRKGFFDRIRGFSVMLVRLDKRDDKKKKRKKRERKIRGKFIRDDSSAKKFRRIFHSKNKLLFSREGLKKEKSKYVRYPRMHSYALLCTHLTEFSLTKMEYENRTHKFVLFLA